MTDAIHFLSLSLTNVRAFGGRQTLDLSKDGAPSRWCVILGENGVGKTTLLQALAVMRPVPAFGSEQVAQKEGEEAGVPKWVEPSIADYENDRILDLVRDGEEVTASLTAGVVLKDGKPFEIGYDVVTKAGKLISATPLRKKFTLPGRGALIIAYSAFRHAGHSNLSFFEDLDPTEALFDERIELVDPDEVAATLDYNALTASRDGDEDGEKFWTGLQDKLKIVIADLIPDLTPDGVLLKRENATSANGIRVQTPSGIVPLAKLSLGAQTTVAWAVDLAWRLHTKFPKSQDPFSESAIVLIDEVELHLHPIWQRSLRDQLLAHFPKIQFIVTTHAPVMAQESIAAGDPISIVRWEGDHSTVIPGPLPAGAVRLDEVATGLFELETSLPTRFEALLRERRDLIRKDELTDEEKYRLAHLHRIAHAVQTGAVSTDAEMEKLMSAITESPQG